MKSGTKQSFNIDRDFSQNGEQHIILDFFSRCTTEVNRYCVDAGAYDGLIGSNSRALFLSGWRGVAIEPNPRTFARLKLLYADRHDIQCVQSALSDSQKGSVAMKFSIGPEGTLDEDKWKYAQVSTLNDAFAASYEKDYGYVYETSSVNIDTLSNVLRDFGAPEDIGFLSIDCEGEDLKIVKELDLKRFRPVLICVEADDNNRHFYAEVIERQGYSLFDYTVANAFFSLNSANVARRDQSRVIVDEKARQQASDTSTPTAEKVLEEIWEGHHYERGPSYTNKLGLMLQPSSFADFRTHPEFGEAFRRWTQRDSFRGLDFARVWSLVLNAKHVLSKLEGSVAELGVYQGQSSAVLSLYAQKFGRRVYLADTFQGFAEQQFEKGMGDGQKAAFKDVSLEFAQTVVGDYSGIRWVVGMFPDSATDEMREDRYAFVSIDCDIYEPIAEGLKFFWPRMVPGGMIFVHDYSSGHWPGATRAVDEFCERNEMNGLLLPDYAGSFVLIRPGAGQQSASNPVNPRLERDENKSEFLLAEAESRLARAHEDNVRLAQNLAKIEGSKSWRLTEPLRMLAAYLRTQFNIR